MKQTKPCKFAVLALLTVSIILSLMPTVNLSAGELFGDFEVTPFYVSSFAGSSTPTGYTPNQTRTAYHLPDFGGAGTTIAIIDAYHTPSLLSDYTMFCHQFGLPDNSSGNLIVHTMGTAQSTTWAQETILDVEWARAIAPNATILLVEAENAKTNAMYSAISYATSQPNVVAVSMSWGLSESTAGFTKSNEDYLDTFLDEPGIVFFAASGDDGADTAFPAVSSHVVGVGGTTLNLDRDGNVISETAWSGSGGGESIYQEMPTYQENYGVNGTKRCVPDVSYNANPATGVSVYYNGGWYTYGGTSAGAPQWAAIYALGLTASNPILYALAQTDYPTYFRDITAGSNGYSAELGYDYVTGLGSPLTYYFSETLEVSPTAGGPNTNITLAGQGIISRAVNISYLDPIKAEWIFVNETEVTSGGFTLETNAPDLLQANPSDDNAQNYDSIVFRATDEYGHSCNSTVPFTEYHRGVTQIGAATADGIYGNNTVFGTDFSIQNGETIAIEGLWFKGDNGSICWDNQSISTITIDETGAFSTNIEVPPSCAGQHTINIQDNSTIFLVNVTVSPKISHDYDGDWQTSDFQITLTADLPVDEIYYNINSGETQNVTASGQPIIATQSGDNTLDYWYTWSFNGTSVLGTVTNMTSIKLDKTAPIGTITTGSKTSSRTIILTLNAADTVSGVSSMRFSNDESDWSSWEAYSSSKSWDLTDGNGEKGVYVQFKNGAGLVYGTMCKITLETLKETTSPQATTQTTPTPPHSSGSSSSPTPTPAPVPEFSLVVALSVLVFASLLLVLLTKKQPRYRSKPS